MSHLKCLNVIRKQFFQSQRFAVSYFKRYNSNNKPLVSNTETEQAGAEDANAPQVLVFFKACSNLCFYFIFLSSQREPVLHFKGVKGELKCFKKSLRDLFELSSAIPLWSACHSAGCISGMSLSLRLVPGGEAAVAAAQPLRSQKVWYVEKAFAEGMLPENLGNEFEAFWLTVSSRYMCCAHQLPVHITRASVQARVGDSPQCSLSGSTVWSSPSPTPGS